jgi:hypothetical protein
MAEQEGDARLGSGPATRVTRPMKNVSVRAVADVTSALHVFHRVFSERSPAEVARARSDARLGSGPATRVINFNQTAKTSDLRPA